MLIFTVRVYSPGEEDPPLFQHQKVCPLTHHFQIPPFAHALCNQLAFLKKKPPQFHQGNSFFRWFQYTKKKEWEVSTSKNLWVPYSVDGTVAITHLLRCSTLLITMPHLVCIEEMKIVPRGYRAVPEKGKTSCVVFHHQGPKLWNFLPGGIRKTTIRSISSKTNWKISSGKVSHQSSDNIHYYLTITIESLK